MCSSPLIHFSWRPGAIGLIFTTTVLASVGLQRESFDARLPEEAVVGFQPIVVAGRNVERSLAFQQQIVPLVLNVHLEALGLVCHTPEAFAIEVVLKERQQVIHRTETVRRRAAVEIDASRDQFAGIGVLGPRWSAAAACLGRNDESCICGKSGKATSRNQPPPEEASLSGNFHGYLGIGVEISKHALESIVRILLPDRPRGKEFD